MAVELCGSQTWKTLPFSCPPCAQIHKMDTSASPSRPGGQLGLHREKEAGRPARATPTPRGAPEDFRAGPAPEA